MAVRATHRPAAAATWRQAGLWGEDTVWSAFTATASAQPGRRALLDGDVRLDFATLQARAARIAGGLAGLGVAAGDVVVLQLPNWWETVATLLACARLGAVAAPLLAGDGPRTLAFVAGASGARVVVAADGAPLRAARDVRDAVETPYRVVVVRGRAGAHEHALDDLPVAPAPPAHGDASALALLLHTSGTTAEPKGVLHSHETLLAEARSLLPVHGLGRDDAVFMPAPLAHMAGIVHALLVPAVAGSAAVLADRWEPSAAAARIAAEGVSYMVGPPTFLHDVAAHADRIRDAGTFRLFSCGGADVDPALVTAAAERLGCIVKRVYGSTEFPTITTTGPDDPPVRRVDSDGRAIGAAEVRVVDESLRPLPADAEGEILARGPDCCLGYRDPAHTDAAFTADGWFRTGDLGRLDAGGWLRVVGRAKDVIIRKGENISAREVEELVASHPAVAEVAVVGLPDAVAGEIACAVVRLHRGAEAPSVAALGAHLLALGLEKRKLPERIAVVDALPRGPGGKVLKRTLRERLRASPPA